MAYASDVKDKLRRLFVFDNLSLEVSAQQLSIPFNTASRWKREAKKSGDDWEKVRAARLMSGNGIEEIARTMLTQLIQQFQSTMEQLESPEVQINPDAKVKLLASLSDSFNKSVAASKRIMPATTALSVALEVVQQLTEFIKNKYPQHLAAFAEILEPFGRELERKYD